MKDRKGCTRTHERTSQDALCLSPAFHTEVQEIKLKILLSIILGKTSSLTSNTWEIYSGYVGIWRNC